MSRPLTIWETQESRKFSFDATSAKGSWKYKVITDATTNNEIAVKAAALAASPAIWALTATPALLRYQSLFRSSIDADPVGGGLWDVTVSYDRPGGGKDADATAPADTDSLDPSITFDLRGEPQHVSQSLATYSKTNAGGGAAIDYSGAVGVGPDGKVEGTDILAPALEFSVTVTFLAAQITHGYLKQMGAIIGTTNNAPWWAYKTDEVRFMGATGASQADGTFPITFKFSISFEQLAIVITPTLTVPRKPGWFYLWVAYKPKVNAGGRLVDTPIAAYVEQIFRKSDFSLLGLG